MSLFIIYKIIIYINKRIYMLLNIWIYIIQISYKFNNRQYYFNELKTIQQFDQFNHNNLKLLSPIAIPSPRVIC